MPEDEAEMSFIRPIQIAVLTIGVLMTAIYSIFMGGVSLVLNNFLRFNPNGHPWDFPNDRFFLAMVLGTLGIPFALEVVQTLIQHRFSMRKS